MVSIIVPVYNVEKYLYRCVDSILTQTYRDIQVILVDDGSPDKCGAICDEYAQKDQRVLTLHKTNGGVSSARNYGLKHVTGEFVTFCDSDDAYMPNWIEQLVTAAEINQADVVLGHFKHFFSDGSKNADDTHEIGIWKINTLPIKLEYCFDKVMSPKHGWEITTRLFRTAIIRRERIRFCETCGNYAEDLGFVLEYSMFARKVVSIEAAGYQYYIRENSMMQSSTSIPKLESLKEVYCFFEPYCRSALNADLAEAVLPLFYLQMIGGQFLPKVWSSGLKPEELRKIAIAGVADWPSMENRLKTQLDCKKAWNPYYSGSYNTEMICHMRYLLGGPWWVLRLQCKLIRVFRPMIDLYGRIIVKKLNGNEEC